MDLVFTLEQGKYLFVFGAMVTTVFLFFVSSIVYLHETYKEIKESREILTSLNNLLFKITSNIRPEIEEAHFIEDLLNGYEYEDKKLNKASRDIILALFYNTAYLEKVKKALISNANKLTVRR